MDAGRRLEKYRFDRATTPLRNRIALPSPTLAISDVTCILDRVQQGDPRAAGELLPLVYEELRKLAAAKMAQQAPGQTLQATALVHEAYLRLTGGMRDQWQDRTHFFRAAAEAMRCILIENARRKSRWKRGARLERVEIAGLELATDTPPDTLLVVHEALEKLTTAVFDEVHKSQRQSILAELAGVNYLGRPATTILAGALTHRNCYRC